MFPEKKQKIAPNQGESRFFERLAQWEEAPRAMRAFDEILNKPIGTPPTIFYARLYQALIDHLLHGLQLPVSSGAMEWEWKPLYQFGLNTDPFYFTEASIQSLLNNWPTIEGGKKQVLQTTLKGYFHLRREGFPSNFPSPLLTNADCDRWVRIFPAEWSWECITVLRRVGLVTMVSRQAYRTFVRFSEGAFEPVLTYGTLKRWQAECWQGGFSRGPAEDDPSGPYRANFVASVSAGRFRAMGINGFCPSIPDCRRCPMHDECRWYHAPVSERPSPSETLSLARRGMLEHLRTDQLLQALFHLPVHEMEALRGKLAGHSLRQLAGKSFQELEDDVGFHWLLPERLRVTFEICQRFNEERLTVGEAFRTPWDIFKHFQMRLRDLKQEEFIVVLLDNKKRYLNDRVVTRGTLNASPVHPREVFNAAIKESAAFVVIVHNHPSGDAKPSREDIEVTRQLMQAGELVGIPVLDHVIIADNRYTSLMEEGLLEG
jgi:DNA repair protein RadC